MLFSRALFLQCEKLQRGMIGPWFRHLGQSLYKLGARIQGNFFHEDTCMYLTL